VKAPAIAAELKAALDNSVLSRQRSRTFCHSEEPKGSEEPAILCPRRAPYFVFGPVTMNALTVIPFGCKPTGIMVSNEYSVGSSFRAVRF